MLKKVTCLFFVITMLFFCGCRKAPADIDENVFELFMNALKNGNFAEAYSFLSSKCILGKNDAEEDKFAGNRISLAAFEKIYLDSFKLIGLETMEYSVISEKERNGRKTIQYLLKYNTSKAETLENEFTMNLTDEGSSFRILWSPSLIFPDMTRGDSLVRAVIPAKRGDIVADGQAIAMNVNLVTVYAVPAEIVEQDVLIRRIAAAEDIEEAQAKDRLFAYLNDMTLFKAVCGAELNALYDSLAGLLQTEREEISKAFDHVFGGSVIIKQYYPDEISAETCRALEELPGIRIDLKNFGTARYYPYGKLMAHSLGYVGMANEAEIAEYNDGRAADDGLYNSDSFVGKNGLEKLYEKELRGKDGYYFFIRGADGANKKTLYRKEAENGLDVNISVDLKLQQRAEELLDIVLFGNDVAGAVVVMNPKTGAVQAMASNPSYDLNSMTRGLSTEEYDALINAPNKPLFNRPIAGRYPPGSTFKAFTASAALDLNVMNENYVFTGKITDDYWKPTGYGTWIWPPIKRVKVYNRSEPMNMMNCMLHSDNIYFANMALKIGAEKFIDYISALGMDSKLPFELSAARPRILNEGASMNYKLLADSGYGQGNLLVSPLQLASMFCAFRNGGSIPSPYITESLNSYNGASTEYTYKHTPETWKADVISEYAVSRVTAMLEEVVNPNKNGTGRSLRVKNCDVAGKTGSAEIGSDKERLISWFAGYRLNVSEDDERVVLVMLEIPDRDKYTSLKFQIARSLLEIEIYDVADTDGTDEP